MGLQDLILFPIYLIFVFFIAAQLKSRLVVTKYDESVYYKILGFKLFAVTFFSLIYFLYYGGGDTFGFFAWSQRLVEYFFESPGKAMNFIIATDVENFYAFKYSRYVPQYGYLLKMGTRELYFIKVMFFINLLGLNTYIAVSYILTLFAFVANWLLYKVFVSKFPTISKQLVYSVMLIPSVAFWGGGILKDTLAFIGICVIVYCVNQIFIQGEKKFRNIVILGISVSVILAVRGFVVLSLIPAIIMWIFTSFQDKIKSPVLKYLSIPVLVGFGLGTVFILITLVGNELGRFSVDELDKTIKDFQGWHEVASADGSGYTLHVDGSSPLQMLKAIPEAINVTFFRPYLWEASGAVVLLSAVESLIIFIYFLYVFFIRGKIFGFLKVLVSSPIIQMCFIFAMLYGFMVGFTSYNFGALSRYKIPAMPFFVTMLVLISFELSPKKTKK